MVITLARFPTPKNLSQFDLHRLNEESFLFGRDSEPNQNYHQRRLCESRDYDSIRKNVSMIFCLLFVDNFRHFSLQQNDYFRVTFGH